MKKQIGVIGVGSAGIVSIAHIIPWLSNEWDVVSIYDPSIKILGIGESTMPNFVQSVQLGIAFDIVDDLNKLDGTIKFGTKYKKWREQEWVNPFFGASYAVHFNNFKFKELAFERFKTLWPNKFKVIEGKVDNVVGSMKSVKVTINGQVEQFDYVIDCRGFPETYEDYNVSNCTTVNHCLIYSTDPNNSEPFTEHVAMEHGWMFGIPLTSRNTYGYLYNDTVANKDDILADMSKYFKTDIVNQAEYQFKSYYAKKIFSNRVLKNGNRALFFEPLSANSIYAYTQICELFVNHLQNPQQTSENEVNKGFIDVAKDIEDFISFLYLGGSTHDTAFWQGAKSNAETRLAANNRLKRLTVEYNRYGSMGLPHLGTNMFFPPANLRIIDKELGYKLFNS
jgi:tryptophan halogenase